MNDSTHFWVVCAAGSCSVGLYAAVVHILPLLQFAALIISIGAGLKALWRRK